MSALLGAPALVPDLPSPGRAAVRGGVVGNYVDQLHIFLPVTALAPALTTLAGPATAVTTGAIVVMATLLGRPLGAMVFGRVADQIGRTRTTRIAIAGTAATTLAIAAMPTHELIGPLAISLVIALRFLGGFFLAGEYSAAIPLSMEWSRPRSRGLVSGLIMSMAPWAQATIAVVTAMSLTVLGPQSYAVWGWRLSFLAGGLASLAVLIYYARQVSDAPLSRQVRAKARSLGLREVLAGRYRWGFWQMFGLMTGLWFMTNMVVIVLTSRLVSDLGLSATTASLVMASASVAQAVVMSTTGHLSTTTGRRHFFVGWGLLALCTGPLLWWWTLTRTTPGLAALGAIGLQVVTVCAYGPIGAYLSERFPAEVRSTGYGTAYSLSIVVPALYPYYLPTMESWWGRTGAPAVLLALGALLVIGCAGIGPRLSPGDLDDDVETVAHRTGTGHA